MTDKPDPIDSTDEFVESCKNITEEILRISMYVDDRGDSTEATLNKIEQAAYNNAVISAKMLQNLSEQQDDSSSNFKHDDDEVFY